MTVNENDKPYEYFVDKVNNGDYDREEISNQVHYYVFEEENVVGYKLSNSDILGIIDLEFKDIMKRFTWILDEYNHVVTVISLDGDQYCVPLEFIVASQKDYTIPNEGQDEINITISK